MGLDHRVAPEIKYPDSKSTSTPIQVFRIILESSQIPMHHVPNYSTLQLQVVVVTLLKLHPMTSPIMIPHLEPCYHIIPAAISCQSRAVLLSHHMHV